MAREKLEVGEIREIKNGEDEILQAKIVGINTYRIEIKTRKAPKGRFGKPSVVTRREFWRMVDAAA